MKNQSILFYSRCLLAILAITGTGLEIAKYGIGMLMYYTVLSNLLVAVFAVYMVYAMNKGQNLQDQNFLRIKAGVTMSIMITCVVYHIMLAPLAEHFWRVENLLCHYIVPIYFLLDTLIVDRQGQYKWLDPVGGPVCHLPTWLLAWSMDFSSKFLFLTPRIVLLPISFSMFPSMAGTTF